MTVRERVEALPIRPIGDISHGANPSLKIHLLPNAGTERNVRSSEYLAEPTVDQCIVGQCSLFLAFFRLFFSRRCKGPSNNLFARHPGNAPLTRPTTRPRGAPNALLVFFSANDACAVASHVDPYRANRVQNRTLSPCTFYEKCEAKFSKKFQ